MSRRIAFGALLVAAVLVGAYLTAARQTQGSPLDPSSTAPDGARAVVELVDALATMDVLDEIPGDDVDAALVLQDRFDRDAQDALLDWVDAGGTLVVADVDSTTTPPVVGTVTGPFEVTCAGDVPAGLADVSRLEVADGFRVAVPAGAAGSCSPPGDGALVVVEDVGAGRVVSVAGPSTFTNRYLDEADNAVLAAALLAPDAGTRAAFLSPSLVVGTGDAGLVDLVDTPVRAALAQLVVAFLLAALWRARRLGRPVAEPQPVPIEASELTQAVGRVLARSDRPGPAAAALRDRARRDLSAPLGLPLDASAEAVVDALSRRTELSPAEARRAAIDPVTTDDDLVEVATLLTRIRKDTTHGRRPTHV
ncbi:MAG TPA: DUF4350 domain-containing protein [Acidimicrobiales bacterium]|nr:DUF4350 domain-containing protein [Acidimicrobiales bacterium]